MATRYSPPRSYTSTKKTGFTTRAPSNNLSSAGGFTQIGSGGLGTRYVGTTSVTPNLRAMEQIKTDALKDRMGIFQDLIGSVSGSGSFGGSISSPGFPDSPTNPGGGGGYDDLINRVLGELEGYGSGERSRIETDFGNESRSRVADLQSRGLGSSTLTGSVEQGVSRQREQALAGLSDRIMGQRASAIGDLGARGLQEQHDLRLAQIRAQADAQARQQQFIQSILGSFNF